MMNSTGTNGLHGAVRTRRLTMDRALMAAILALQIVILFRLHSTRDTRATAQPGYTRERPSARNELSRPGDDSEQGLARVQSHNPEGSSKPPNPLPAAAVAPPAAWLTPKIVISPMGRAQRLHRQMNEMNDMLMRAVCNFEEMESSLNMDEGWPVAASPTMDMRDEKERYVVLFSLPGLSASDVKVTLEGRLLTVTSNSKARARQARAYEFEHRVWLPGPVQDEQQADAVLTNGVLCITIPKAEQAKSEAEDSRLM